MDLVERTDIGMCVHFIAINTNTEQTNADLYFIELKHTHSVFFIGITFNRTCIYVHVLWSIHVKQFRL